MTAGALLEVAGLSKAFGAHRVLADLNMSIREGETRAIIGPNGAGKTTLVNLITGVHAPSAGRIVFAGEDVTRARLHARARRGLSRTYQITSLFDDMTARDNVEVALVGRRKYRRSDRSARQGPDGADALLQLVGLSAVADQRVDTLSHGDQRLLEVAVVLACDPRLVLLDEPSAGMSPAETAAFVRLVNERLKGRVTVILIEHDMSVVLGTADRISVLANGRLLAEGTPDAIMADAYVREAYLGRA